MRCRIAAATASCQIGGGLAFFAKIRLVFGGIGASPLSGGGRADGPGQSCALEEQLQQVASSPGIGGVAEASAKEQLRITAEQLGHARSESLRSASSAALAVLEVQLTMQLDELSRFAVAEACGKEDKIFKSGFVRHSRLLLCTNMNLPE